MTPWQNIPESIEDYEGFVYLITNLETQQKYVGRKYFWRKLRVKRAGKSNRRRVTKESDWREYLSSSIRLKKLIAQEGIEKFSFEIIHLGTTRSDVNYLELKEQVNRDVLKAKLPSNEFEYYNDSILSRYFKPKEPGTAEYKTKCDNISKALKQGYAAAKWRHPLEGKPHPNRGKKLPQTGHKKIKGKLRYTDGTVNIMLGKTAEIPSGFWRGMTVKERPKEHPFFVNQYKKAIKYCAICGIELSYKQRKQKFCSRACVSQNTSNLSKGRYAAGKNPMAKYIYHTPAGIFQTAKEAARCMGVSDVTVRTYCRNEKEGYRLEWRQ